MSEYSPIICGSAQYIPFPSMTIDMIITSPPYFNAKQYSGSISYESYEWYKNILRSMIYEMFRVLKHDGRIAINVPHGYDRPGNGGYKPIGADVTEIMSAMFELRGHIIWNKMGQSPQGQGTAWGSWQSASNPSLRDVHEIIVVGHKAHAGKAGNGVSTIDRETFLNSTKSVWDIRPVSNHPWHPAPYPDELARRLIELYTYKGDIVLDPFSGSGTTVRVAQALGRVGIGLELSYEYCLKSLRDVALAAQEYEVVKNILHKTGRKEEIDDLPLWGEW